MSPVDMVCAVAETGRACAVTLHPKEIYDQADLSALDDLSARFENLTIGGDTLEQLRSCAFVVTQNSAVAFDGYILEKPAVLFAQVNFRHIALNVSELGVDAALAQAPHHAPPFARYLDWFLRCQSLDMMAVDADQRIVEALRGHGWPV